jgi:glycerol-3-phosphate acyltransferase PlsX
MSDRLNPSTINGGPFLGLNGVVVKSHGGADARGFANAVRLAANLGGSDILLEVSRTLGRRATLDKEAVRERTIA